MFYVISLKKNIKVDNNSSVTFNISKLILKNYALTTSIPSALVADGNWGENNLTCFVGNQRISIVNDASRTANYTVEKTQIIVPKL